MCEIIFRIQRNYVSYRYCVLQGMKLTRASNMPFLFLSFCFERRGKREHSNARCILKVTLLLIAHIRGTVHHLTGHPWVAIHIMTSSQKWCKHTDDMLNVQTTSCRCIHGLRGHHIWFLWLCLCLQGNCIIRLFYDAKWCSCFFGICQSCKCRSNWCC